MLALKLILNEFVAFGGRFVLEFYMSAIRGTSLLDQVFFLSKYDLL
eukprot:UN11882